MKVYTRLGEMDDSQLLKREDAWEDEHRRIEAVEYCAEWCGGGAHRTGEAHGTGCFCPHHVHRSVSVTVKQMPEFACAAEAARLE